jgi:integrase
MEKIDTYKSHGTPIVENALKLLPLIFVRVGELREAKWEDFDFERKEWRFCSSKTDTEMVIPLARQAIEILKQVEVFTGQYQLVFPGANDKSKSMSNNAIRKALQSIGYNGGQMTGHGFRAMARTLLEEELNYPYKYIELQLSHKVRDPLGRAYNRAYHLEQRHKMMQAWADYLDELKASPKPDIKALREKYKFQG